MHVGEVSNMGYRGYWRLHNCGYNSNKRVSGCGLCEKWSHEQHTVERPKEALDSAMLRGPNHSGNLESNGIRTQWGQIPGPISWLHDRNIYFAIFKHITVSRKNYIFQKKKKSLKLRSYWSLWMWQVWPIPWKWCRWRSTVSRQFWKKHLHGLAIWH